MQADQETLPQKPSRCKGITRDGRPCGAAPVRGTDQCAGHAGLGLQGKAAALGRRGNEVKRQQAAQRERDAQTARMSVAQRLAFELEASAADIVQAFLDAIKLGTPEAQRRADMADRLLTRVYGKPTETVQVEHSGPPRLAILQGLDLEGRLELLGRIRGLEAIEAAHEELSQAPLESDTPHEDEAQTSYASRFSGLVSLT